MSDADFSDFEEDAPTSSAAIVDSKRHARAQHNALERRRRDNIKDMYGALKDAIPGMKNERASRAAVLKKAIDLIVTKQTYLNEVLVQNEQLERENSFLENKIERLRKEAEEAFKNAGSDDENDPKTDEVSGKSEAVPMTNLHQPGGTSNRKRPAPFGDDHSNQDESDDPFVS